MILAIIGAYYFISAIVTGGMVYLGYLFIRDFDFFYWLPLLSLAIPQIIGCIIIFWPTDKNIKNGQGVTVCRKGWQKLLDLICILMITPGNFILTDYAELIPVETWIVAAIYSAIFISLVVAGHLYNKIKPVYNKLDAFMNFFANWKECLGSVMGLVVAFYIGSWIVEEVKKVL